MSVITVARQLGAGGGEVATRVAEALGWPLLDRSLVERIASEMHVPPEEVVKLDERTETFIERIGLYLSEGFPETLMVSPEPPHSPEGAARAARRIIAAVVEEGPCVIVGHGAQCVLHHDPRAFHVLVHAPFPLRVERAAERFNVDAAQAEGIIRKSDTDRSGYIRAHFEREWLNPALYHLCVDGVRLGMPAAAELVRTAALEHFERDRR
ncbi:MAG TPA: cytidylate kinase-like family protein [Longimicrobiaceae bacterium]|nr:cytidylate kinase-like family protein [Longimicrobiaceae bacterium]